MKKIILLSLVGIFLLSSCVLRAGPNGGEVIVVPPLPVIVELDMEPFYFHSGYYYHYYDDHHWTYSHTRNGPWKPLPPGYYPKEVRWKGKSHGRGHRDEHGEHDDD